MEAYRKVERKNLILNIWQEISFLELKKDDVFKLTDIETDGSISESTPPLHAETDTQSIDGVLQIEAKLEED